MQYHSGERDTKAKPGLLHTDGMHIYSEAGELRDVLVRESISPEHFKFLGLYS